MTLRALLCVGAGGFCGAITRYLLSMWIDGQLGSAFPWATLAINATGSFALGALYGAIASLGLPPEVRLLLGVGFLGGYTTFSTFSVETVTLFERDAIGAGLAYVAASVALSVLGAVLGLALGRSL
ncbi:MAG TPA: fluoride efflux transporter CrcB [Candidatus Binatia bacterium]